MLDERAQLFTDLSFRSALYDFDDAGIVILPDDGRIVSANEKWHSLQGSDGRYDSPGNLGSPYVHACRSLMQYADARSVLAGINDVQSGARSFFYAEVETRAGATPRWLGIHVSPLTDQAGVVSIAHEDISSRIDREIRRMDVLAKTRILDSGPEAAFDDIVERARRAFAMPVALFTLVDENRQWFKAKVGLDISQTPRSASFCAHAVGDDSVLVVEDASKDRRFDKNILVVNDPRIRFYAGVPIHAPTGEPLGTLCVIDFCARRFTSGDLEVLEELAEELERRLRVVLWH